MGIDIFKMFAYNRKYKRRTVSRRAAHKDQVINEMTVSGQRGGHFVYMSMKDSTNAAQMSICINFFLMLSPPPTQGSGWPTTVCGSALIKIIPYFPTNSKENSAINGWDVMNN